MRYTLLFHYPEIAEDLNDDVLEEGRAAMASYAEALTQAEVLVSAEVLQPSDATTTLRTIDGELVVQDGPFADTKDHLGGTVVLDVADLDAAVAWASKAPAVGWGAVEIRPGAVHVVDGVWRPNG